MATNLFIKNNIEKIERGGYTDFLDPVEKQKIIVELNKKQIPYRLYSPFNEAEKTIIYTDIFPKISLLEIKCKNKLKHNEILGSLFSHNISITKYGDIIAGDQNYLLVMDTIKNYLINNLINVGKYKVLLEEVDLSAISNYKIPYEKINLLVSSLRLDNVVSSLTYQSRSQVNTLFKDKSILVNYVVNNKKTYILKENDIISIRKYGKYRFDAILKKTNKNRYILNMRKYL